MTSATRSGAGSPSHDPLAAPGSGRFLSSKRCVLDGGLLMVPQRFRYVAEQITNVLLFALGPGKSKPRRA